MLLGCAHEPAAYIAPYEGVDPPPSVVEPPPGEPTSRATEAQQAPGSTGGSEPGVQIPATVKQYRPEIEACLQTALRGNPRLNGRVAVGWTVTAGRVSDAALVGNTTGNDALGACVVAAVEQFRFPADITGTVPSYTWILSGE